MEYEIKSYDHHQKAGNQGDICKHVALVAALHETVSRVGRSPFRFADLYAGYAKNPIVEGNEWPDGIAKLAGEHLLKGNGHIKLWAALAGLNKAPRVGGFYPGSALFATQVCDQLSVGCELSLWDTGAEPFKDLTATFRSGHHIFNRAAAPDELAINGADFVFIDPPDKAEHTWMTICEHIGNLRPAQSLLIWLPVAVNTRTKPPTEDKMSAQCRSDFFAVCINDVNGLRRSLGVTKIRWAKGGRTIGCQRLYCVNASAQHALREAVDEVVGIAGWPAEQCRHYDP